MCVHTAVQTGNPLEKSIAYDQDPGTNAAQSAVTRGCLDLENQVVVDGQPFL